MPPSSAAARSGAAVGAVVLALVSAVLFGAMTVGIRFGFLRCADAELAPLALTSTAFVLSVGIAAAGRSHGDTSIAALWPFVLAGVLSPGLANAFFTRAIAATGASRASVVVGMAPLVAVAVALVALHEPLRAPLVSGALLIVLGGLALASERARPADFRLVGLALAFAAATLFAARDNVVRWLVGDTHVAPLVAASATLLGGTMALVVWTATARRRPAPQALGAAVRAFAPAAVFFAASYATLFEAYFRGRVTVVSPLVATESLWGVTLSAMLLGRRELVGRRIFAGAALVVAGGVLIGAAGA